MNATTCKTNTAARPGLILIVDDNPEARRMLEARATREGYQTILAANGREALEVLTRQPVDVVLLDIDMPEMNGYGVLAAINADPRLVHTPVLIISGGGDQDDLVRCIEMGAVDYLPKPFNQAVLRARIGTCLARKRQRDHELQQAARAPHDTAADLATNDTNEWCPVYPKVAAAEPSADAADADHPAKLGRIAIERLLGGGASGRVYLGRHELLDLPVAVKVLRPELTATPVARERFLREARLAAHLAHRHIVRLLEVNESDYGIYLAFEYVAGGTLSELLDRQPSRRLPVATAIRMTQEVASALAEANRLGITHRDIKPPNLLLTPEEEVKVADFGLAKQSVAAASSAPHVTMEGVVIGTPLYMAPEQLTLGTPLDVRTDLYGLGCVLYEMLAGHAPLVPQLSVDSAAGMQNIFYHQVHTPPQPPRQLRSDIPSALEEICLTLLAKRPADRFPTPEALLAALKWDIGPSST
jgi:CheY-like chemotaxis protein/tRNA A-37 threonylcarbamoyl transferase component Bud32